MPCHRCGATGVRDADRCPDCGTPLGVTGSNDDIRDETVATPLATDGGEAPEDESGDGQARDEEPTRGESTGGQSTSGQPTGGQPEGERGGGQPTGGQSARGRSTGGQPGSGRPAGSPQQGGQPAGGQAGDRSAGGRAGGQPTGDEAGRQGAGEEVSGQGAGGEVNGQPTGGPPAGGQPQSGGQSPAAGPAGQPTPAGAGGGGGSGGGAVGGGYGHQGGSGQAVEFLKALPFARGAILGALSLLIPYVLVVAAAFVVLPRRAVATGTELFFLLVGFGPGDFIVDAFVDGSQISSLSNVPPEQYPTVEAELGRVLDVLTSTPEALLLGLYVLFPLILYLSARYLTRVYTTADDLGKRAAMPLTLVAGTLPVAVVLAAAFPVVLPGSRILAAGIALPLLFGTAGAATVVAFGRYSWFPSKTYGWAAALVGLLFAAALLPLPPLPPEVDVQFQLDLAQRFVLGIEALLATTSFEIRGIAGAAIFLLAALVVGGAGFLRVHRSAERLPSAADGARLGASVMLGYLAVVALLGIVLPLLAVLIPIDAGSLVADGFVPFGVGFAWFANVLPDVGTYTRFVVLGGVVFPTVFGSIGGGLAIWYRDRQVSAQQSAQPRQPT